MKIKKSNLFIHSCIMVKKTYKNYLLLSVTVFLSFSLMLGYLVYTDSEIYNKFNEIFGASPHVILSENDNSYESKMNIRKLTAQLDKMLNTHYYLQPDTVTITEFGNSCEVRFLPNYVWGMFSDKALDNISGCKRVKMNNEWQFSLSSDEAIVSEIMYQSLKQDSSKDMKMKIVYTDRDGKNHLKEYKIVGSYTNDVDEVSGMNGELIYVSSSSIHGWDIELDNTIITIYSNQSHQVLELLKNLQLGYNSVIDIQKDAITEKQNSIMNKYNIAIVLFVLLGINLYSSFKNALNERKYEIGIKRALGASNLSIMIQFAIEGFVVMFINILLSIFLILNLSIVYKYIQLSISNNVYTITMSFESVLLFITFSFFLSLIFSILFAYQCTQVEIIKYLKEE